MSGGPLSAELLAAVRMHLERAYPHEGCGVILEGPGGARSQPLANACAGDPRQGFAFEPREWLRVCRDADAAGERVVAVFHSHVDAPALLSAVDRAAAAPGGVPLLPGVLHLVEAVRDGRADEARAYRFKGLKFEEEWRVRLA